MISYKTVYQEITNTNAEKEAKRILKDAQFLNPQNFTIAFRDTPDKYRVCRATHPLDPKRIRHDFQALWEKRGKISRLEEWTCKLMVDKTEKFIGKIVDYQIPLKTPGGKEKNSGLGKVDLISNNEVTHVSYLLELKVKNSNEHPLKAIMEVYTYWQMLGGDNALEFLNGSRATGKILQKAILIYQDSKMHHKLAASANTQLVMRNLGVKCFLVRDLIGQLEFEVTAEWSQSYMEEPKKMAGTE